MAQWIWKFGEFEIYHNMLLHNRRTQYGYPEPPVWKIYSPDTAVRFTREVTTEGGEFRVAAKGDFSVTVGSDYLSRKEYGGRSVIPLEPGTTRVSITVSNLQSFPCLYVDGVIETDERWQADDLTADVAPVGCYPGFDSAEKSPDVFPFRYEPIAYQSKEEIGEGVLFDYGQETFARTAFTFSSGGRANIQYGESREEALDPVWSVIRHSVELSGGSVAFPPQAFRYIYVDRKDVDVSAEYEYLPLEYRGSFRCDEEVVNRVWDIAAYTFHLNSREFLLDGIKRDRWVWSGDAYQSLFVNHYLFFDADLEKRTLIALGGKSPFKSHINTIMDYTFFWMISLYEYYKTYGDRKFLEQIYPQAEEIMRFCRARVDEDGFVRERPGDWIFIDWAPMDKTGALCAEQVLFAKALSCYAEICRVIGEDTAGCSEQAEALNAAIVEKFYDPERRLFIDSYESGKRNVSRHSNILAYLFLPMDSAMKADIYKNVILNDDVRQITTPYFKFYENQVHCEAGNGVLLEQSIREYYGSMLLTGATTLYEEYDPTKSGVEHYAMYGNPYQKSLCHAWSASPIYLLGCYRAGVKNTGIAYDTFEVRPQLGDLNEFDCTVPVPQGSVCMTMNGAELTVCATITGGTLIYGDERIALEPGETVALAIG